MKSPIKMMLFATAATLLAAAIASPASAQRGGSNDYEPGGVESAPGGEREMGGPQAVMGLWMMVGQPVRCCESRLPLAQIRDDLNYLQYVDLSQSAFRGGELNFKAVAKSASEIRKRAARLRNNLALPGVEKGAEQSPPELLLEPVGLKAALSKLWALIRGAMPNPVLRGRLLDFALAGKARRDLDEIVELSERVRKSCELINKTAR